MFQPDERIMALIVICVTLLLLALMGVLWQSCDAQEDRRAQCIERYTPADCSNLFKLPGDKR